MVAIVQLQANMFAPRVVHIRKGGTVRWQWPGDGVTHTVTGRGLHSGFRDHGSYRVVFRKRGTYRFHCEIHAGMTGRVIVGPTPNR